MRNRIIYQIIDLASDLGDLGVDISVEIEQFKRGNLKEITVRLFEIRGMTCTSFYLRSFPYQSTDYRYRPDEILDILELIKAHIIDDVREAA